MANRTTGCDLLAEARAAGLTARAEGDRLVVRGPRSAEALMRRLLAHKPDVLAALAPPAPATPPAADAWDDARAAQVVAAVHARIDRALQVGGEADTDARRKNALIDKKLAEDFRRERDLTLWGFLANVEGVLARWRRTPGTRARA
jgi:hypothetical protein